MKNSVVQDFVDEKGIKSEMIITSDTDKKVNLKLINVRRTPYKKGGKLNVKNR